MSLDHVIKVEILLIKNSRSQRRMLKRLFSFIGVRKNILRATWGYAPSVIIPLVRWRNCHHIHAWVLQRFNHDEDGCPDIYMTESDLRFLLDVIEKILADHSLANTLLPSPADIDDRNYYDDYYFYTLEDTKLLLTDALSFLEKLHNKKHGYAIFYEYSS